MLSRCLNDASELQWDKVYNIRFFINCKKQILRKNKKYFFFFWI